MSWISFLCFIICILIAMTSLRKNADFFSPARIFGIIWSFAIGLADFKFSRFQVEWSAFGWFALMLCVVSFFIGVFIVYVIHLDKQIPFLCDSRKIVMQNKFNADILYKSIVFLFFLYIISYTINTAATGYIPLFSGRPAEARTEWGVFGFGLITHSAPSILFFVFLLLLFTKQPFTRRLSLIIISLITFISYFFLLQRFDLVLFIILSVVYLYYGSNKMKFRNILFGFTGFSSMMYLVSTIRMSKYFSGYLYVLAQMKFSEKYAMFTEPYMYIAMNLENFARVVPKLESHSYGYFTFNFVTSLTGIKHWIKEYAGINDYPFLTSGYNTYSMFFDFFRDFGLLGIMFIPFVMGFFISAVYYWMRKNPDINSIAMYSIAVFVMIFSFFINAPGQLHFFLNTVLIFAVTRFINKQNILASNEKKGSDN